MALILTLGLLLLQAPAAEEVPPEGCRKCDHRGVTECKRHNREARELARWVHYSSEWAACKRCGGTLLLDCKRCEGGPESAAEAERREAIAEWNSRLSPTEEHLGRRLLRVSTVHFDLEGDFPTLRGEEGKVQPIEFLLLMARDLEQAAEQMQVDLGLEEEDFGRPIRFWFFGKREDHNAILARFLKNPVGGGDYMRLGAFPGYSVQTGDSTFQNDADHLGAQSLHNGVHMLLGSAVNEVWIGEYRSGWFDGGAAHHYERVALGVSTTFCIYGRSDPPVYHQGEWEDPIRKALARARDPVLPGMLPKPTQEMDEEEHALSWSLYNFILETWPEKLGALFRGLKEKRRETELFPELFDCSLLGLEQEWRDYVKRTYGRKKKSRRR